MPFVTKEEYENTHGSLEPSELDRESDGVLQYAPGIPGILGGSMIMDLADRTVGRNSVVGNIAGDMVGSEGFAALTGGAAEGMVDNVLGIPGILGGAMQEAGALLQDAPFPAVQQVLGEPLSAAGRGLVQNLPTGREVLSFVEGPLRGGTEAALAERNAIAERNPVMSTIGGYVDDTFLLHGGRKALRDTFDSLSKSGGLFDDIIDKAINKGAGFNANTKTEKLAKSILEEDSFKTLARGLGRSVETGVEAAALSILQGEDPIETGIMAAVMQGAGSAGLTFAGMSFEAPVAAFDSIRRDGKKTGMTGKILAGLSFQAWLLNSVFNFIGENPIEAEESAFDKARMAAVIGLASVTAKRSKPDGLVSGFPELADFLITTPRTGLIKTAQMMAENQEVRQVISNLENNPEAYSERQLEVIKKAIENGTLDEAVSRNFNTGRFVTKEEFEGQTSSNEQ
jgi:hypothetical protein